ncbi:hypothetical protein BH24BAC1_BH24BAC1_34630 [soil metagenome]
MSEILLYQTPDGEAKGEVNLKGETVWLTQQQLTILLDRDKRTISHHIQAIFKEGELDRNATVRKFRTVQTEGARTVTREVEHHNLDVIISVGYRVKSVRGTQFRIWANKVLRDHLLKGYTLNEKRLRTQKFQAKGRLKARLSCPDFSGKRGLFVSLAISPTGTSRK